MRITVNRDGRTFEAYVSDLGMGLTEVSFYEVVRPKWKILRTTFLPFATSGFWIIDYPTIIDGIQACLNKAIAKEEQDNLIAKRWQEFNKRS